MSEEQHYRTALVPDEDGQRWTCIVIKYQGKLWLAPNWTLEPARKVQRPDRIILMDPTQYQVFGDDPTAPAYYGITHPIPKGVLGGQTPPEKADGFVVIDRPDIVIGLDVPLQ